MHADVSIPQGNIKLSVEIAIVNRLFSVCSLFSGILFSVYQIYVKQEKLFRKRTVCVTHRSQNIENTWAFLSFKVDMTSH